MELYYGTYKSQKVASNIGKIKRIEDAVEIIILFTSDIINRRILLHAPSPRRNPLPIRFESASKIT